MTRALVASSANGSLRYCGKLCATNNATALKAKTAKSVNPSTASTSQPDHVGNAGAAGGAIGVSGAAWPDAGAFDPAPAFASGSGQTSSGPGVRLWSNDMRSEERRGAE